TVVNWEATLSIEEQKRLEALKREHEILRFMDPDIPASVSPTLWKWLLQTEDRQDRIRILWHASEREKSQQEKNSSEEGKLKSHRQMPFLPKLAVDFSLMSQMRTFGQHIAVYEFVDLLLQNTRHSSPFHVVCTAVDETSLWWQFLLEDHKRWNIDG